MEENVPQRMIKSCRICGKSCHAYGLCKYHYQIEYRENPENEIKIKKYNLKSKEGRKAYNKQYRQRPEVVTKRRAWAKEYQKRPDVRAKRKEYNHRPDVRAKKLAYNREHNKIPEIKAKRKAYYEQPERKAKILAWRKQYYERPDVKARMKKAAKKYNATHRKELAEYAKKYYEKHPEKLYMRAKKLCVFCPICATYTMTIIQRPKQFKCSLCGNIMHNPKTENITKNLIYKSRESYLKRNEEVKA